MLLSVKHEIYREVLNIAPGLESVNIPQNYTPKECNHKTFTFTTSLQTVAACPRQSVPPKTLSFELHNEFYNSLREVYASREWKMGSKEVNLFSFSPPQLTSALVQFIVSI